MATFATTAPSDNSSDANFRAWINVVHDLLTQPGGWVQTSDTGQIDFDNASRPTVQNQKVGYAIYRMDDALQSTFPVFLKLAFGSGNFNANQPAMWFSLGTATDGAGNLIDPDDHDRAATLIDLYNQTTAPIVGNVTTTALVCFGSVSPERFSLALWETQPNLRDNPVGSCTNWSVVTPDWSPAFTIVVSIERARDWNGNAVGSHLIVTFCSQASRLSRCLYVEATHELPPVWGNGALALPDGLAFALPHGDVGIMADMTDDAMNSRTHIAASPIPFKRGSVPAPPGLGVLISKSPLFKFNVPEPGQSCAGGHDGAYATGRQRTVAVYGTNRTYRTVAGVRACANGSLNFYLGDYVWILYE